MSRSFTRGLLVAPLLATTLMLSACGGDDGADQAAIPVTPEPTSPAALATSPTTPTDATPQATPNAADDKKDDEPTPSPEAADAPEASDAAAPTPTPNQAEAPGKLRPSAERAQNEVLRALTAIETCWTTTSDYSECKSAEQVNKFGGNAVDSKNPKPTQVAVTRATKSSFKIVGTDKAGTRWVLTKFKSGSVTRKCKRKNGDVCNPSTW